MNTHPDRPAALQLTDDSELTYEELVTFFTDPPRGGGGPMSRVVETAGNGNNVTLRHLLQMGEKLSDRDRSWCVLNAVREDGEYSTTWSTPLLEAIDRQRYDNIVTLLQHGADPSGVPADQREQFSMLFRRTKSAIRPLRRPFPWVDQRSAEPVQIQTSPIMAHELELRSSDITSFWTTPRIPSLSSVWDGSHLHSLLMAARTTPEMFQCLLDAGADASFWTQAETPQQLPDVTSPSSLCVSTPLHHAICSYNVSMIETILGYGFDPNARALAIGGEAFTPMQQAIRMGNIEAYRLLSAQPSADVNLLTPVYKVHLIHLAVALLRLDVLQAVQVPLSSAKPTALQHTLLHIACLPLGDIDIQLFAPKIRESIHDIRSVDAGYSHNPAFQNAADVRGHVLKATSPDCDGPGDDPRPDVGEKPFLGLPVEQRRSANFGSLRWFSAPSTEYFDAQLDTVKKIVKELGSHVINQTDYCGNTALHYLASGRIVHDELVKWLRCQEGGNDVWRTRKNRWGHTPTELWLDSMTAVESNEQPEMRGRSRKRSRMPTK